MATEVFHHLKNYSILPLCNIFFKNIFNISVAAVLP